MKKRLMVVAIMALSMVLATGAMSASRAAWPPATLGFQWGVDAKYTILTLQLNGTARMHSPVKFYTLSGVTLDPTVTPGHYAVSGSGYVLGPVGAQEFFFSLSASRFTGANLEFFNIWGNIQQHTQGGVIFYRESAGVWGLLTGTSVTLLTPAQIKAFTLP